MHKCYYIRTDMALSIKNGVRGPWRSRYFGLMRRREAIAHGIRFGRQIATWKREDDSDLIGGQYPGSRPDEGHEQDGPEQKTQTRMLPRQRSEDPHHAPP